uniref:Uncharacterized protein n=1 Tax=Lotharella globosa TaxID=91324 RepID=A0A7S4DEE1_9EUKA
MAMGFYENSRPFSMGVQNRSNIVERRRRRMGARKHRRYLNSILATHDRLAELSQSEVEFEEEQFPDFNEYKSYFVPGKELRDAEEVLKNDDDERKAQKKPSGARVITALKKRLSKNTRKLLLRSCTDSKFFIELESTLVSFKVRVIPVA